MDTVRNILETKGSHVHCVRPETLVYDALELMARHDIGAVVVCESQLVVGVFGEREYARRVILQDRSSRNLPVSEVMTRGVPFVTRHDTVERCMALMTENRVRHLPVVEGGRLGGLVSIGDVVHALIAEREYEIDQLRDYVSGVR